MQRWLARFSFSFFILAAVLLWEAYAAMQGRRGFVPQWKIALYFVGAVLAVAIGAMGVRARHRQIMEDDR